MQIQVRSEHDGRWTEWRDYPVIEERDPPHMVEHYQRHAEAIVALHRAAAFDRLTVICDDRPTYMGSTCQYRMKPKGE